LKLSYIPGIDGLRALSVLSVCAFHFGFGVAQGGYIGVDVFFVISGFLIISAIRKDLEQGSFSFVEFYARRIRRIAPALAIVLLVSIWATLYWMPFSQIGPNLKLVSAAALSFSNIYLYNTANYFAAADRYVATQTWSLSVEEQFYVIIPIALVLIFRASRSLIIPFLICGAIISFAISALQLQSDPSAAFYLLPSRAWELALGGLIGAITLPKTRWNFLAEILAVAGIACVIAASLVYRKFTPFPGPHALLPCLGAALAIASFKSSPSITRTLMSWAPVRLIGQASYSIYLWHWLVMFASHQEPVPMSPALLKLSLISCSVALGIISWIVIETPFRKKRIFATRKSLYQGGAAVLASILAIAVFANANNHPNTDPRIVKLQSYTPYLEADTVMRRPDCFVTRNDTIADFDFRKCISTPDNSYNLLIFGDSLAAHLYYGFARNYSGIKISQATASGCRPIPGTEGEPNCLAIRNKIFSDILPVTKFDAIVVSAYWFNDDWKSFPALVSNLQQYAKTVYLVGPTVRYFNDLPILLARQVQGRIRGTPADWLLGGLRQTDQVFRRAAESAGADYLSVLDVLCPKDCATTDPATGTPIQFDTAHFTKEGSDFVASLWRDKLYAGVPVAMSKH
jgi:peptidoglycan/LPS O-acetylase OafA/YrhL